MNVYVRDLTAELGRMGVHVDVFTRSEMSMSHTLCTSWAWQSRGPCASRTRGAASKAQARRIRSRFVDGIQSFAAGSRSATTSSTAITAVRLAAEELSRLWGGTPIIQMFHTLVR